MKFLRILLLPLLSVLLVTENQALGEYCNSNLGASSIEKSSEKTNGRVANLTNQGGGVAKVGDFTSRVAQLQRKVGKNSVTIPKKNSNVWYRYDLQGPAHKGIPTPHVQRLVRNVNPKGEVFWNKDNKWIRKMTEKDLKSIEKHLESVQHD